MVVPAREALVYLEDVLADNVKVVEQPVPSGPDVDLTGGGGHEPSMRLLEDAPRFGEPSEQPGAPAADSGDSLAAGNGRDALGELLRTQQLAADRTGK